MSNRYVIKFVGIGKLVVFDRLTPSEFHFNSFIDAKKWTDLANKIVVS